MAKPPSDKFSRRAFIKGSGAVAAASAVASSSVLAQRTRTTNVQVVRGKTSVTLNINGESMKAEIEPRTTLLDVLRYEFDLTGAKPVSLDGSSGASTVLVDGRPVMASNTLAISVIGREIQTVESLAGDEVPKAFVEHDAQQCGFCTPGFVVAVRAFLNKNPNASEEQVRSGLNGNICRCGTYANVIQAAVSIAKGGQ